MKVLTTESRSDHGDFETIYLENFDLLVGISVRKFHVPPTEAETLAHEVFLSYLRRAGEIHDLSRWLVGAICYASRHYWRLNGRNISEVEAQTSFDRIDPASTRILESLPNQLAAREALEGLSPRYRQILQMRYFEGCSINEIAGRLGVTPKYAQKLVAKCLHRAHKTYTAKGKKR
jgi:RNA polymerase sigma factor (sigma-70 family)